MGEIAQIERGAHLVALFLDLTVGELGLTQGEAHVLAQIAQSDIISMATLHHEFGHKRSTLTNLLDRLERRKLVRRERNRDDRRSFVVILTPSGRRAARQVTGALDRLERELGQRVEERDLAGVDTVVRALDAIVRRPRPRLDRRSNRSRPSIGPGRRSS